MVVDYKFVYNFNKVQVSIATTVLMQSHTNFIFLPYTKKRVSTLRHLNAWTMKNIFLCTL